MYNQISEKVLHSRYKTIHNQYKTENNPMLTALLMKGTQI